MFRCWRKKVASRGRQLVTVTNARRPCQLSLENLEARYLLSGDPVLRWNDVALDAMVTDHSIGFSAQQRGPTLASWALAVVHVAIYDAVANVDGTYAPYLTRAATPTFASLDAAVAQTAHDALV